MSSIHENFSRRKSLSAAKRALLDSYLQGKITPSTYAQTIPHRPEGPVPLSFAQERLWFLEQLAPGTGVYHIPAALRLRGRLSVEELRRAFSEVVRRHEVLRTAFTLIEGRPTQLVGPPYEVAVPVVDLSHLPEEAREREAMRELLEQASRPFDLGHGPLSRVGLWYLGHPGGKGTGMYDEYILLFVCHHIIFDGWSVQVLVRELVALYSAYCRGQPTPLPELPIQYADYAYWQRQQREVIEQELCYWKGRLAGAPPVLDLPTDRVRPLEQSYRGASYHFILSPGLTAGAKQLSQRRGVTLFMLLLAAFKVLLHRLSGQRDLCVGTPVANRIPVETEGLIGSFVNTLVLRTELSGSPPFTDFLAQVREMCLGAQAHQNLPFERLVDELQPVRDLGRSPLIQVMIALQNVAAQTTQVLGLEISPLEAENRSAKFDLSLDIMEEEAGLGAVLEYSTDLFDRDTIVRMAGHYRRLLAGIVASPEARLSELPLLTEVERRQLLIEWNATALDYPCGKCIHELFEAQVERQPEAIAVLFGDKQLSYGELNRLANQVAWRLRAQGVGAESVVGIATRPSLERIVGLLGILKAGAAFLPLEPGQPQGRWEVIVKEACPAVVLASPEFLDHLPASEGILCLDKGWTAFAGEPEVNPGISLADEQLAYVLYTSGSTGRPKGVMVPHRGLRNRLQWGVAQFGWGPEDVVIHRTALSFDVAVWEILGALVAGARLAVADEQAVRDPERLVGLMQQHRVTWLECVPSLLQTLSEVPGFRGCLSLRGIGCGGEELSPALAAHLGAALPEVRLYNLYGPTETSIDATLWECRDTEGITPIGRPIANTQVYLLDRDLNPVPVGVVGELYISGVGLARGYIERPDRTGERFIPNPFGKPGSRLYRTGDLGRYRPDGNIAFLGRVDHQIKLRGYRIELGEVEARLLEHPEVKEGAVVLHEVAGDKRLWAYVVLQAEVNAETLRTHLAQVLPAYMVPAGFTVLEYFPRSVHGKLDRAALPTPEQANRIPGGYAASRNLNEQLIADLWAEVLGVPRIGIHDNFFELGGHSLLATQVIARIRSVYQRELPLRALFEAPTVAGLAARLAESTQADSPSIPPIQPLPRDHPLPLSFAQERLWFLDQLEPGSSSYNIPMAFKLQGELDVKALAQSLNEVVRRHEALRTTFQMIDGQPLQVVEPGYEAAIPVIDLSHLPEAERGREAELRIAEAADQPFDLAHGPLLRVWLWDLGPCAEKGEYILLLSCHHIVFDGWSAAILIREWMTLYQAYRIGQPASLPVLPIQYADYAQWQRQWLEGPVSETQLAYWRSRLEGASGRLDLLTDRPRPPVQSHRGASRVFDIPAEITQGLKRLSRLEGVTRFMVLLAAFKVLLQRLSGQCDFCVGTPIANRTRLETEGLIGCFVNTLVLRTDLSGDPRFVDYLDQVRQICIEAQDHQDLPFERLVEALQPVRDPSRTPLIQVMFALQNTPLDALEINVLTITPLEIPRTAAQFDLALDLAEAGDGLMASFEYCTDLFEAETIERLAGDYQTLLQGIVARPEAHLSELPLSSDAEWRQAAGEGNATPTPALQRLPAEYIAPRNLAEQLLADLWAEVLGLPRIGIHDNFFEIGGHSLLAVRLIQRIRERLSQDPPLIALFQAPTVAEFAALMHTATRVENLPAPLILLRKGTVTPPLYCIHTGTGHARDYQPLVTALKGERTIYGIQMPAFLDPAVPTRSMDLLAEEYAELLLKQSPGQPVSILGWSLGGLIALSVAAKLEQKGARIGFLGILDTGARPPGDDSWIRRFAPYLHDSAERARLHGLTASERHALETELKLLPPEEYPAYLARWGQERGYWFSDSSPELLRLESQLWRHTEVVEDSFALPQLAAPLHVWWARDSLDVEGRTPMDWSACTDQEVIEHVVDGDHGSIIRRSQVHHEIRQAIDTTQTVTGI